MWLCLFQEATIAHEFLHTLGFMHEVQRADRDKYVEVHPENMFSGAYTSFMIMPDHADTSYSSYDISSSMHYDGMVGILYKGMVHVGPVSSVI